MPEPPVLQPHLIKDFVKASQRLYDSLDYDPFHPMIVHLSKGLPKEEALWLSVIYMAYYNIGSAIAVFDKLRPGKPVKDWMLRMPVGVQRRNLRGGLVDDHLGGWANAVLMHGSLKAFLTKGFVGDPKKDWFQLRQNVGCIWGNGRWSVYTTAELFQKANKLPVLPCDVMNEGSSGPRAGLSKLYGLTGSVSVEELDELATQLFAYMRKQIKTKIFYLPKGHYDYGMLESQLCDFNSMMKGRYYIGRDIDRDMERIVKAEKVLKRELPAAWEAREAVFEKRYLGEFNDWWGRTQEAKTYYQKYLKIADHKEINERLGLFKCLA